MNTVLILAFQLVALIFSVIVHEVAHGAMALKLGDTTAQRAGRLTLNPLKHLDLFGSFLVPVTLFLLSGGSFVIGWAKPVPYNPLHLKNPKQAAGLIALAGPLSNFALAIVFGILIRILLPFAVGSTTILTLVFLFNVIVFINILLGVFNLVPLPPLDGSNILFALLPLRFAVIHDFLRKYGFFLLLFFIFFGFSFIIPLINGIHRLIVGNLMIS